MSDSSISSLAYFFALATNQMPKKSFSLLCSSRSSPQVQGMVKQEVELTDISIDKLVNELSHYGDDIWVNGGGNTGGGR